MKLTVARPIGAAGTAANEKPVVLRWRAQSTNSASAGVPNEKTPPTPAASPQTRPIPTIGSSHDALKSPKRGLATAERPSSQTAQPVRPVGYDSPVAHDAPVAHDSPVAQAGEADRFPGAGEQPIRLKLVVQAAAAEPIQQSASHPQSRLVQNAVANSEDAIPELPPAQPAPLPLDTEPQRFSKAEGEIPIVAPQVGPRERTARAAMAQPNPLPSQPPADDLPAAPQPPLATRYSPERCRELNEESAEVRATVRENLISKISLDITPTRRANLADPAESKPRQWRNRLGEVVATGRFTDYKNGRIWVTDASGNVHKIPFSTLSDDDHCFVAFVWGIPTEFALDDALHRQRDWVPSSFAWKASEISYKPTYFEEVQLERYGHSLHPFTQPVVSGAHFFLNIAVLPYKMGIHPINECQHPLGYYRPGSCAPWLVPPIPLSIRGGLVEAGTILGGVFALP